MRITSFLLFMALMQLSASKSYSQTTVSLTIDKEIGLADIFKQIEQQTEYLFNYRDADIAGIRAKVNARNSSIAEVLSQALNRTGLSYSIKERHITITKERKKNTVAETPEQLTGIVSDQQGEPLMGVAIMEEGTDKGTISDAEGKFSIQVGPASVLRFSYLGYTTQTIKVGNRKQLDIKLLEDAQVLEEVVIVGYGTTLKKNLTTSISSVKTEGISKAANSNMAQLLMGRAAGLQASISSPQPGGNISLSIRGAGTPIFVVDGVMMPSGSLEVGSGNIETPNSINRAGLAGLNPNDIETIEILKDASASIYGIGAANGVILITTKKGVEGKPRITVESNYSVVKNYPYLKPLNAQEYMNMANVFSKENYLFNNGMYPYGNHTYDNGWAPEFTPRDISQAQTTDWLDLILKTGSVSNHNLSISGGSSLLRYYLSGNYYKQEGTVANSSMERYALRTNVSSQVLPFLKLTAILNVNSNQYNNSNADGGGAGGVGKDALQTALSYPSYLPVYNEEGNYTRYRNYSNPAEMNLVNDGTNSKGWYLNLSADVDIIKNMLTARLMYGTNQENAKRSLYIPSNIYYYEMIGRSRGHLGYADRSSQTIEGTLSFNKQFGEWLRADAVAGVGLYYNGSDALGVDYQNAKDNIGPDNIGGAEGPFFPSSSKYRDEKRSQFVRLAFDVLDRYVLNTTLRRDGTDKFFPGKKYALFPSVSLAWKVSNESFVKDIAWVNQLKIRASYGQTGQDNLGTMLYGNYEPSSSYVRFSENSVIYIPYIKTGADYPDVSWEKTIMKNVGLDFSLFKDRIGGSFDWFRNDVTDLLGTAPGEPLNMAGFRPFNYGHYYRTGWDATLTSENVEIPKTFKWTSRLTLTRYNMFWVEREPNYDYKEYQLRKKEPMNAYYYYDIAGIINMDKSNMPESQYTLPAEAQMPGYPIIKDRNNDGMITTDDIYVGNSTPDIIIGLGNTFTYKDFDLDIFLYGQFGAKRYNYAYRWALPADLYYDNPRNSNIYAYTLWNSQTNPNGTRRGISSTKAISLPGGAGTAEDMQDASFVRIRNITLGYNIDGKKLGTSLSNYISGVRVFFDVQNPATFTKFAGVDPEIYIGNSSSPAGYPMTRTFSIGARINFN